MLFVSCQYNLKQKRDSNLITVPLRLTAEKVRPNNSPICLFLYIRIQVMTDIHRNCLQAAERYGDPGNYFSGANIAGFIKVANGMLDQGNT